MYKAIISFDENTRYNIETITGERPKGLIIDDSTSGIIATADEFFNVSLFYKCHCVAVVACIEQPSMPKARGVSLKNHI